MTRIASRFAPASAPVAVVPSSRYLIVPCEGDGLGALAVVWDRLEEQVIDVIDARLSARYADEDALWDEARPAFDPSEDFRMAA